MKWTKRWAESSTTKTFGLYEPVNALSSYIASMYVLKDIKKNHKKTKTKTLKKILKFSVFTNLICSFLAHGTYKKIWIKLDGITMTIPIIIVTLYYKHHNIAALLLYLMFKNTHTAFTIGIIYIFFIVYNNKCKNKKKKLKKITKLIFLATMCWWLDQTKLFKMITNKYKFINLHSMWHILCTIGLMKLINLCF